MSLDLVNLYGRQYATNVQILLQQKGSKLSGAVDTDSYTGAAKTGVNGGTSTSFTAANEVDVATGGANSRINTAKIRAVREIMESNHIDFSMEEAYIGVTAQELSATRNEIQMIGS